MQFIKMANLSHMTRSFLLSVASAKSAYYPAAALVHCRGMTGSSKDELYRQITVEVKAHDPAVLKSYEQFTKMAASELGVEIGRIFDPPKDITRRSLLKSVFVHKKHFHQYEQRTVYKVFDFKHLTGSTASTFLEYIQRNLPEGMAMKVTKYELNPIPDHLKPPARANPEASSSS